MLRYFWRAAKGLCATTFKWQFQPPNSQQTTLKSNLLCWGYGIHLKTRIVFVCKCGMECTADETQEYSLQTLQLFCRPVDCSERYDAGYTFNTILRRCIVPSPSPTPRVSAPDSSPSSSSQSSQGTADSCGEHGTLSCSPPGASSDDMINFELGEEFCVCFCDDGWSSVAPAVLSGSAVDSRSAGSTAHQAHQSIRLLQSGTSVSACLFSDGTDGVGESDVEREVAGSGNCSGIQCILSDSTYVLSVIGLLSLVILICCLTCKPCRRAASHIRHCGSSRRAKRSSHRKRRRYTSTFSKPPRQERPIHSNRSSLNWDSRRGSMYSAYSYAESSRGSSAFRRQHPRASAAGRQRRTLESQSKYRTGNRHHSFKPSSPRKQERDRHTDAAHKRHPAVRKHHKEPTTIPENTASDARFQNPLHAPAGQHTLPRQVVEVAQQPAFNPNPEQEQTSWESNPVPEQEQVYWDESGQYWWDDASQQWVWAGENALALAVAASSGASDPNDGVH